jgi:hypothetical protein
MIAKLAVENLDDLIERDVPRRSNRILLEPHIMVRESTDQATKTSHAGEQGENGSSIIERKQRSGETIAREA